MIIFKSPQHVEDNITYDFKENLIKVTLNEEVTFYDLSTIKENVDYVLDYPFIDVKKIDGELNLTLINPIDENASEKEKFPEWEEATFTDFEVDKEPVQLEVLEDYNIIEEEPKDTTIEQPNEEVEKLNDRVKELEALVTQLLEREEK